MSRTIATVAVGLVLAVAWLTLRFDAFTGSNTIAPLAPVSGDGWELVFNDEFEAPEIDGSVWTWCYWWEQGGCTNEASDGLEWYRPEQRFVEDGVLHLRAERGDIVGSNGKLYPFRSGMVTSGRPTSDLADDIGFAFTYGRVEARVRLPVGQGLWPAFWMLPITHESRPEIDVVETLGHRPDTYELHFHTHDEDGERVSFGSEFTDEALASGWHTIAVDWSPEAIVWIIDGVERWRVEETIPDEPLYLIFNLAVGGDWPGPPDDSTVFPAAFEIDYVRVWQVSSEP